MKKEKVLCVFAVVVSLIVLTSFVSADGWVTVFETTNAGSDICTHLVNTWSSNNDNLFTKINPNNNEVTCSSGAPVQATTNCAEGVKFCSNTPSNSDLIPIIQVKNSFIRNNPKTKITYSVKWESQTCCGIGIFATKAFVSLGCNNPPIGSVPATVKFVPPATVSPTSVNYNSWYTLTFNLDYTDPTQSLALYLGQSPGVLTTWKNGWCPGGFPIMKIKSIKYECYSTPELCDNWDNDCDGTVDEGVCCTGKTCGVDELGRSCGSCSTGFNCNLDTSQCVSIINTRVNTLVWKNNTNKNIIDATINDVVNLSVYGQDLNGKFLNYIIFKLGSGRIANFTKVAFNNTFDTINFTVNQTGNYSFVVRVVGETGSNRSMNLSVVPYPTRYVACSESLPASAFWNSFEEPGKFKQSWINSAWFPLEKGITFDSQSLEECTFSCNVGFVWNSVTKTCDVLKPNVVNCSQFETQATCDLSDFAHLTAAEKELKALTYEGCGKASLCADGSISGAIECYCKWDADKKCRAVTSEDQVDETKCKSPVNCVGGSNFCEYTSTPSGDCNVAGTSAITVTLKAKWNTANPIECKKPAYCVDEAAKTYPCVSTEELPFFGWFNFAVAFICIGFIYFLTRRKL